MAFVSFWNIIFSLFPFVICTLFHNFCAQIVINYKPALCVSLKHYKVLVIVLQGICNRITSRL